MEPTGPRFGGGASDSIVHPLVLVAVLIVAVLLFTAPRKKLVIPLLSLMILVPLGQQFVIAGIHLFILRLLILIGLIAVARMPDRLRWNHIDTAICLYVAFQASSIMLLYQSSAAVINQAGFIWDFLGGYFLLRQIIQDEDDIDNVIVCFSCLLLVFAITMTLEQSTLQNVFGYLGGVRIVPEIRDGKIRSQGPFAHSLTAGAFGATCMPLLYLLWRKHKHRVLVAFGAIAAVVVIVATQTSTSLLTAMAAMVGIAMWPLRKRMQLVRQGLLAGIIGLNLVMKAPVWFLIARIDLTGSSSSYHRAELIDRLVNHFSDWWLIGTKDFVHWGWDMWDAQNMFVSTGETGGLFALVCFISIIVYGFKSVGRFRRASAGTPREWEPWLLGTALFAHTVAFWGVNYFDQVRTAWFALLAMIPACAASASPAVVPAVQRDRVRHFRDTFEPHKSPRLVPQIARRFGDPRS